MGANADIGPREWSRPERWGGVWLMLCIASLITYVLHSESVDGFVAEFARLVGKL